MSGILLISKNGVGHIWQKQLLRASIATPSSILASCFLMNLQLLVFKLSLFMVQRAFADSQKILPQVEEALTIEITQRLPVPAFDTPLENLVRLRESPAFRRVLDDLLEWKRDKAPAIALSEDRQSVVEAALRDFDKLTKAYSEAMDSEGHKKIGSVASVFFAVVTGEPLGAVKEALVSFRELREPCWKKISALKCAPGGVVYHFRSAMR